MNNILAYLDELYPNPKCELEYSKDYELLIAIVLSAQTTDKRVNIVDKELFTKYDTLDKLARANPQDIAKIIKSIGTYTKKSEYVVAIAKLLVQDDYYCIPNDRQYLEKLPGVGRKTINVFLSIIYNEPCIAVDTHVNRVSKRLGLAKEMDSVLQVEHKLMKKIPKEKWNKAHHQLVFFGRYQCKALKPNCTNCKLKEQCKYYSNH
jgi:endonuclease III